MKTERVSLFLAFVIVLRSGTARIVRVNGIATVKALALLYPLAGVRIPPSVGVRATCYVAREAIDREYFALVAPHFSSLFSVSAAEKTPGTESQVALIPHHNHRIVSTDQ